MDPASTKPPGLESETLEAVHPDDAARSGLLAGQPEAMRALVARYERPLLDLAARYLPATETEDVVTETFVLLWRNAERIAGHHGSLWGYLARIARNRCIDQLRRARSRPLEGIEPASDRIHPAPGPDSFAQLAETSARLWNAVEQLPTAQAEALLGAYRDGRSHSELAEHLALPLGTIKTRIRLGLEALRQKLEPLR